jgi:predicted RNA polymerase sigma factor
VLSPTSAIALTLRAVGGLTTAEIARAFLVPEATMAQRISRAKQRVAGEELSMPSPQERPARLRSVLRVLYLMFNEGYTDLTRADLSDEAIRLARHVHAADDDAEVSGLLALMLLTDARRPARTDASGTPVTLADQDRSLWDRARIAEGTALLDGAIGRGAVGEYQLQAAIAALHDRAADADATDWPQILALYELLERMTGSPVVMLNRAVASAMVHGPAAGLAVLDDVDGTLPRVDQLRAHLHELAGDRDLALTHYVRASGRATNVAERRYLDAQVARLSGGPA